MAILPASKRIRDKVPSDDIFSALLRISAGSAVAIVIGLVVLLVLNSRESIVKFGFGFITSSEWNPITAQFGALPFIYGTVITSAIGLVIALPFAISTALLASWYLPNWIGATIAFLVELLAAIPSVVFGVWGLFVLAPLMRTTIDPLLQNTLGKLPLLSYLFPPGPSFGQNLFTAGVILSIMITPTIMSVSRAVIVNVPKAEIKNFKALGATNLQILLGIVWPHSRRGIVAGAMLGLARALGETMAVTMVVGNASHGITPSLLSTGYTLASGIANNALEADSSLFFSAVVELGLMLLLIDAGIGITALVLKRRKHNATTQP